VLHLLGLGKSYCARLSGTSTKSHKNEKQAENRSNTWIYVSDMKMNIFIGIKTSGNFQHSSCKLALISKQKETDNSSGRR
jgi:hypothetical protein